MKKLHKIRVLLYTLALALAFNGMVRSDTVSLSFGDGNPEETVPGDFFGTLTPAHGQPDSRKDTGNIYADTPQIAVPRNTSVSSQPRQHSATKRPGQSFSAAATFKDGKIITRNTFTSYSAYIDLFPSGTREFRTRFLSLGKLII